MALLIGLLVFFSGAQVHAESFPDPNVEIIFDAGNPESSVGILGDEILEFKTIYEDFEVVGFEKEAIVVKEFMSYDAVKWPRAGTIKPAVKNRARQLFIVKQLRAIHDAQMRYREKFENRFAPSLEILINHEMLADGFRKNRKQGYLFRIASVGESPKRAPHYTREPLYYAVAEPQNPEKDRYYFSVDQFGQIRFAPSLNNVAWGPVWDYADLSGGPPGRTVVLSQN